jgi:hypothetical protein
MKIVFVSETSLPERIIMITLLMPYEYLMNVYESFMDVLLSYKYLMNILLMSY